VRVDFTSFYEREAPRLVRSVSLAVGNPTLAEDAVAEAFARAWVRWGDLGSGDQQPRAWIMRVALNQARDRFRRHRVERRKARDVARPEATYDLPVDHWLWDTVRSLPKAECTLIALRYVGDLSQAEIADVLRVPPGTVASGLNRARNKLGAALGPRYHEEIS